MSASSIAGKTAVVTGGSRGLGAGIAKELARRGAAVMITYLSAASRASEVVANITDSGGRAAMVQADCLDTSSPQKIVQATLKAFGKDIDILVNNAGICEGVSLEDMSYEHYDRVFNINTRFPIFLVQAALPYLRQGGSIVNIGSMASREGCAECTAYCASKAAMESFGRTWVWNLHKNMALRVKTINMGAIDTDLYRDWYKEKTLDDVENVASVQEAVEIVAYMCEASSQLLNGSVITAEKSRFVAR